MSLDDQKAILHRYLQTAREALLWKLEGLSEYDVRRPSTPTGTNLLGLVKHVASVEIEYFGDCFGRPSGEPLPWFADDAEANTDMWATLDESRDDIVRELVDGAAGLRDDNSNLPDDVDWASYVERLERAAATFRAGTDG